MGIFALCKKYLSTCKYRIALYSLLSFLTMGIGIWLPVLTGSFIDGLISNPNLQFVFGYCGLLFGASIITFCLNYVLDRLNTKLQLAMSMKFNFDIIKYVQDLSVSYLNDKDMTYTNQQINQDVNTLLIFCLNFFQATIINIIVLPIVFYICFIINVRIASAFLIVSFLYMLSYTVLRKKAFEFNYELKESQNKYFSSLHEQLLFVKHMKINGNEKEFRTRTDIPRGNFVKFTLKSQRFQFLFSGIDTFLSIIAQSTIYIIGALLIIDDNFSVGGFTIFISYFGIILSKIRYFFGLGNTFQNAKVSSDRISQLLKEQCEQTGGKIISHINSIEIHSFKLSYPSNSDQISINIPEIEFYKNNIYGLVGANGSGKTSVVNLVLGMLNDIIPCQMVLINGVEIDNIDIHHIRNKMFAVTEQDPVLTEGKLVDNIFIWGDCDKNYSKLTSFLEMFNLKHLEIDQDISPLKLSGGEKQKISIIRTLMKNADVLVLDEPTSALDVESKRTLFKYIKDNKEGKIFIIVSHDQEVETICNKIYHL